MALHAGEGLQCPGPHRSARWVAAVASEIKQLPPRLGADTKHGGKNRGRHQSRTMLGAPHVLYPPPVFALPLPPPTSWTLGFSFPPPRCRCVNGVHKPRTTFQLSSVDQAMDTEIFKAALLCKFACKACSQVPPGAC